MKKILFSVVASFMMLGVGSASAQTDADNFYKSDLVNMEKVSFSNQYKMKVAGNLFLPKDMKAGEKYPAIIVGHPMGAVKEQSANLYATKMAERGFVTLSIDLSFWGRSEGEPRNSVSTESYAEGFSAAVWQMATSIPLQRSSRFPRYTPVRRPQPYRRNRYLRQWKFRHQCGKNRSAPESHCNHQHV